MEEVRSDDHYMSGTIQAQQLREADSRRTAAQQEHGTAGSWVHALDAVKSTGRWLDEDGLQVGDLLIDLVDLSGWVAAVFGEAAGDCERNCRSDDVVVSQDLLLEPMILPLAWIRAYRCRRSQ